MFKNDLNKAVLILQQGGLVAMPTETVYGLAADAKNPAALKKIFHAKGRPVDHPLIVHIADISQLDEWAVDVSKQALLLANAFWPGPLTLILKKAHQVTDIVTGGQDTIGIRIPNHPVAHELLKKFGSGVAAPSANRFGRISPTTAAAVREELGDTVDLILDGGQCEVGLESTIVDVSGDELRVLRPGMITPQQIEDVLHQHLTSERKNMPRVSGSLESHYAPETKTVLMSTAEIQAYLQTNRSQVAVICREKSELVSLQVEGMCVVTMPDDAVKYAHDLYKVLRDLDKKHFKQIMIENPPEDSEWLAIRDRLYRAAEKI